MSQHCPAYRGNPEAGGCAHRGTVSMALRKRVDIRVVERHPHTHLLGEQTQVLKLLHIQCQPETCVDTHDKLVILSIEQFWKQNHSCWNRTSSMI